MNWKVICSTAAVLCFFSVSKAAIDPIYKEAMQRGYEVRGDSVRLPDGSLCLLTAFNAGTCGKSFFDQPYCVKEGVEVWDGKCCEGLEPWLPSDTDGQASCQPSGKIFWNRVLSGPYIWVGAGIVAGILMFTFIRRRRMH